MLNSLLLAELTESIRLPENAPKPFTAVSTDTRKITKDALFVPLIGDRFNGHDFLNAAVSSGASAAIWQVGQPLPKELPNDFQLYFVKDTLAALQQMAKTYRQLVNPIVIAVTGSNGKTTTKDLLSAVLSLHGETYKTQGNYNNHIGLPLTILSMPSSTEYLILEMGMSGYREIALLSRLATPDEAIVTNIGESHMEQLGSREGIAKAKMEIREGLKDGGSVILDGDEQLLISYRNEETFTVGFSNDCNAVVSFIQPSETGYSFTYESAGRFEIPLLGLHNVKNAAYCIAVAKKLGLSDELIRQGLDTVSLTGMRLERQLGKRGETIINDAYNASPTSMIAAIETLKALPHFKKRIAVLGDMFELGQNEEAMHRNVVQAISAPLTHLVCVGEKAQWIADEWNKSANQTIAMYATTSKSDAAAYLQAIVDERSAVLFKASRGMKLEEIIQNYQFNERRND
ncbi:UDP-N-acetylmuramoyl-tripeptide--D-alanyl-D-alanine ligase [Halalkalibacter nanhaiisediminis]|uniref:UDP-N-acetylmuramoyl-tripeptide--D-alanyl-D-alanine ligase n=1 Tax=Halalkalibacter nanhaiisediminis TaxID=688079 RepID=A0A562QGA8_9BACI|nr:UDP-N-acetylmuramoyl-tripeptide--D-alanyl-D-alanine ligase [Halalkalibacter nanhaiisediminis]TWI55778.1 UDP-N-acetylmuramoyl-tripeptide--D-alanyl-D-alanine ligase [Halalkalibacter nanhaiisediminis]